MAFKSPVYAHGKIVSANTLKAQGSSNDSHPAFCFRYTQPGFGVEDCEKEDRVNFANRLHKIGSMSWGEIKCASRHGLGYETMPEHNLRVPIPRSINEDARLIVFRFSAKKPMIGFRKEKIFYIVWIDPTFKVYNH